MGISAQEMNKVGFGMRPVQMHPGSAILSHSGAQHRVDQRPTEESGPLCPGLPRCRRSAASRDSIRAMASVLIECTSKSRPRFGEQSCLGRDAELLQHAQFVGRSPAFDAAAVLEAG